VISAFEHKLIKIIDNKLPMVIDMVYDIFRKHNPMLACIAEGHDVLECFAMYEGLDFAYIDNGNHKAPVLRNPYCRIGHAAGKDSVLYYPQKILNAFPQRARKKPKPFRGPILIPNYSRDGLSVHYKRIDFKKL
jgi:hypothetical protein